MEGHGNENRGTSPLSIDPPRIDHRSIADSSTTTRTTGRVHVQGPAEFSSNSGPAEDPAEFSSNDDPAEELNTTARGTRSGLLDPPFPPSHGYASSSELSILNTPSPLSNYGQYNNNNNQGSNPNTNTNTNVGPTSTRTRTSGHTGSNINNNAHNIASDAELSNNTRDDMHYCPTNFTLEQIAQIARTANRNARGNANANANVRDDDDNAIPTPVASSTPGASSSPSPSSDQCPSTPSVEPLTPRAQAQEPESEPEPERIEPRGMPMSPIQYERARPAFPEPGEGEVYLFAYGQYFDESHMKAMLPDAVYVGLADAPGYRWLLCGPRRQLPDKLPTNYIFKGNSIAPKEMRSAEGHATITESPGATVYGRLYILSGALLQSFAAARAETEEYRLADLPVVRLLDQADDAKEVLYAALPHPARVVRNIIGRAKAFRVSGKLYNMPHRDPGTYHAAPRPGAPIPKTASERSSVGKEALYSLRDGERDAARPYLAAQLQLDRWGPPVDVPEDPFPALEAARREAELMGWSAVRAVALGADAQPFAGAVVPLGRWTGTLLQGDGGGWAGDYDSGSDSESGSDDDGSPGEASANAAATAEDVEMVDVGEGEVEGAGKQPRKPREYVRSKGYKGYLNHINRGIAVALQEGLLPRWYVDEALRPWVPYSAQRLMGRWKSPWAY